MEWPIDGVGRSTHTPGRHDLVREHLAPRSHAASRPRSACSDAASILDIVEREGEDRSYVGRMLNLTALAPDIVAAILNGTLPEHLRLQDLAINPPLLWEGQRAAASERVSPRASRTAS